MNPKFKQLIFIDDDRATNIFHQIIVEDSGLCEEVIFFDSAIKALEYFTALIKKEDYTLPDVIFLDINMPMMNGWEFIEEYKKLAIPNSKIIVMLSTSLNAKDLEKAEQIDLIYKFLNKPLEVEHLKGLQEEYSTISQ